MEWGRVVATTARADTAAALTTLLLAFNAANPTLLKRVSRARTNFNELPAAYVGAIDERVLHTSGTRQRTLLPSIVLVDSFTEATEDRLDLAADGLMDYFTAHSAQVPGGELEMVSVSDGEIENVASSGVTAIYRAITFGFSVTIMEGRL